MPLPTTSTTVTFPTGAIRGDSTVLGVPGLPDGRHAVVVAQTPFHPLDHTWPDQPADTGTLTVDGVTLPVTDCLTGAVGPDGAFAVAGDIPVRRGEEGWAWLALHVVEGPEAARVPVGAPVTLTVDEARRAALSAAHTACHLAAFALNAALAPRWRKEVRVDTLGSPDFDGIALTASRIGPEGSRDDYRVGKSLRKKGFTAEGLEEELPGIRAEVEATLARWLATGAEVRLDVPDPALTARRVWHCVLPEGDAHLPCGGTHLRALGELASIRVEPVFDAEGALTVLTTPVRA